MSDGLPRCWTSWTELRASGTHCYGNITVSVFRLGCASQWGNACDVTSRKQTGERGICTIGGNGASDSNVCQTTVQCYVGNRKWGEAKLPGNRAALGKLQITQWASKGNRVLVCVWSNHPKPSLVAMYWLWNLLWTSPLFGTLCSICRCPTLALYSYIPCGWKQP